MSIEQGNNIKDKFVKKKELRPWSFSKLEAEIAVEISNALVRLHNHIETGEKTNIDFILTIKDMLEANCMLLSIFDPNKDPEALAKFLMDVQLGKIRHIHRYKEEV